VFICSQGDWFEKFKQKKLVCAGDDIKSQVGATIIHRILTDVFEQRGATLLRTYQLNTGGNTDFLNMKDQSRLASKKISKTEAVQSQLKVPLAQNNIHVGPSDYVPWQKDNKICFIRMEGELFGGAPISLDLKLSVEDSPNSAGVMIDAIRCMKLAIDRGMSGYLEAISQFTFKHPRTQVTDAQAFRQLAEFLK
jgi:myo-inositol-1-phosphate synthase